MYSFHLWHIASSTSLFLYNAVLLPAMSAFYQSTHLTIHPVIPHQNHH